jgi:hypothetical protein
LKEKENEETMSVSPFEAKKKSEETISPFAQRCIV